MTLQALLKEFHQFAKKELGWKYRARLKLIGKGKFKPEGKKLWLDSCCGCEMKMDKLEAFIKRAYHQGELARDKYWKKQIKERVKLTKFVFRKD